MKLEVQAILPWRTVIAWEGKIGTFQAPPTDSAESAQQSQSVGQAWICLLEMAQGRGWSGKRDLETGVPNSK